MQLLLSMPCFQMCVQHIRRQHPSIVPWYIELKAYFIIVDSLLREVQFRDDVHRDELLEEQLAGVGQLHCGYLVARLVPGADPPLQGLVVVPQQAALRAHLHLKLVAAYHQPLQQEHRRPVANQAVALHLAQPQPAVPGPTLRRLPRQDHARAPR
eukprot:scaffold20458_cov37-Prasinocladus_malaysianus.AAC.1